MNFILNVVYLKSRSKIYSFDKLADEPFKKLTSELPNNNQILDSNELPDTILLQQLDFSFRIFFISKTVLFDLFTDKFSYQESIGILGLIITEFEKLMEDPNFKYSETYRKNVVDQIIGKIINEKLYSGIFQLIAILAFQQKTLPVRIRLNEKVKRTDGIEFEVSLTIDRGRFMPSSIKDRAALALSGPDFEIDIEYVLYIAGTVSIDQALLFIENIRNTGRRRKENEFPSLWPKAALIVGSHISEAVFSMTLSKINTILHSKEGFYYITPEAAPKILPDKGAPASQRCILMFYEFNDGQLILKNIL